MAKAINVGGTQAYIAVPFEVKDVVLQEGYKCRGRSKVPCHQNKRKAVQGMLKHEKEDKMRESVLLEVHGLPDGMVEFDEDGSGKINTTELDGKYLRCGIFRTLASAVSAHIKCMFCDDDKDMDRSKLGQLGQALFKGDVFMCSPCKNEPCLKAMQDRCDRLESGEVLELYHATNEKIAKAIEEDSQGRMIRGDFFGKAGAAGGGIYFGHTPRECSWKYEAPGGADGTPLAKVVFKCRVTMGSSLLCPSACAGPPERMFGHLLNKPGGPYDSVILDRAAKKSSEEGTFPVPAQPVWGTRIEDIAIGEKLHPGYEFVVYSWDQVEVIGRVADDPIPPGYTAKRGGDGSMRRAS